MKTTTTINIEQHNAAARNRSNRVYWPSIGDRVKFALYSDYTDRQLHVWSWFKVLGCDLVQNQVEVQLLNGAAPTETYTDYTGCQRPSVFMVPRAIIASPIGWQPVYDVYCPPAKVEQFLSWFPRGIKVKCDHALDRLGGNAFMPADTDSAPTWGYCTCDMVDAADCPTAFDVYAYIREEFHMPAHVNPNEQRKRRAEVRKQHAAHGWEVESINCGNDGWIYYRSKSVLVHSSAYPTTSASVHSGGCPPSVLEQLKPPRTAEDILWQLERDTRDTSDERHNRAAAGLPVADWILYRASLHLSGRLESSGNSTWMYDPESKGDPVNRK